LKSCGGGARTTTSREVHNGATMRATMTDDLLREAAAATEASA